MRPGWKNRFWAPGTLLLIIIGWGILIWLANHCGAKVITDSGLGCAEFWLNRYQTVLAAMIALLVGYIAVKPVWRQLQELRLQSQQRLYDQLRTRSAELQQENILVYEITTAIQLADEALARLTPSFSAALIAQVRASAEYLDKMIDRFQKNRGPLWGRPSAQAARVACLEEAARFSVTLSDFRLRLVPDNRQANDDFVRVVDRLAQLRTAVFDAGGTMHAAINEELARLATRISAMETALLV